MHLAKGLEFRAVVVMACDDEIIPLQERIETVGDDADLQEVYDTERHLLYVACTLSAWQTVGDADARRLASALERAMPDIPEHDATPRTRRPGFLERFSGPEGRRRIKAVIAFCRGGGFRIE